MTDESFRLTPLDIRRYDFGSALRGYDKARVDQFREQVAEELDRLVRQTQELEMKARGFHEQLRAFRERDKAINEALVSAQQLRAEMREQAEREAQLIVREARAEAEREVERIRAEGEQIAAALRAEAKRLEDELVGLSRARRSYLAQLRAIVERQLVDLDAAEAVTPTAAIPAISPSATPAQDEASAQSGHSTPPWIDSLLQG